MFVKVSETYDLSTKVGKMGFVGIHTPDAKLVFQHYRGLFDNFKKFRYVSCDVAMACASLLPADPLQIGVEAGDIAPQDMFNPILYKAVSNSSMSNLLNRLYAGTANGVNVLGKNSVIAENSPGFYDQSLEPVDQFSMYYALLSDTSGWKKAMPQGGLQMRNLRPLAFAILATQGQPSIVGNFDDGADRLYYMSSGSGSSTPNTKNFNPIGSFMRGGTQALPFMDTYVLVKDQTVTTDAWKSQSPPDNSQTWPVLNTNSNDNLAYPINTSVMVPNIDTPDCFVGAIVLPPAKLNQLYFRLKVTWTVEFAGLRSLTDLTDWYGMGIVGRQSYGTDYASQSRAMQEMGESVELGMLDTVDAECKKIMDGTK